MVIGLALATGFTVVSAISPLPTASSWACSYAAARLPRSLGLLGSDTASSEETRGARKKLGLSDAVLTRAARLSIARSLRATRLIVLRCTDEGDAFTIEAQPYDVERPLAETPARSSKPVEDIAAAVDEVAQRLTPGAPRGASPLRSPTPRSLVKAGTAFSKDSIGERALGLTQALEDDPTSIELRIAAVEALITARDFDGAVRLVSSTPSGAAPPALTRALRFLGASGQLEAGRYSEAAENFETLRKEMETAAVLNNLGVARFRMRQPSAAGLFQSAAFLPDHRQNDVTFNRCLALIFDGKADQALPSLDLTLKADPSDVRTRLLKTWALRLLNRESERGDEWNRLMAIAPSFSLLGIPDLARKLERIFLSERNPAS